ncbi:flagellar hook-basal body complex protein [Lachnospiraceae bacterium WCA-9-b2]|uniref:Flagellar hook protein FlgE n=1 Tax=Sporofaciens musculi TaxID=2681861 RepID=A0A7X3MCI3_9FIRM|nr:flagellar hook-basal body complex protein [Sporofaciens musculi]MXP73904.1 flagellar hook-basal body complex protein [Sporofaciens musculi]MXP78891.1 flagellar hook-basal body complex protein [Sporofaciens musculi]
MVRSMIAGVAGLKAHQSKLDVIGNNIANVNTWSFKSFSYNFQDGMYTNSISSTGGSQLAGAAGGHNASQVGYGSKLSSISTEFNTGAPAPSSNNLDCMIDGTGFFLVGNMVNGAFDNVESSGLSLSRVGIFRVDNNGYMVDNQGSYVYGYAPIEGTGTPETPASASSVTIKDVPVKLEKPAQGAAAGTKWTITIAGVKVDTNVTSVNDFEDAVNDWVTYVSKQKLDENGKLVPECNGLDFTKVNVSLDRIGRYLNSATLTITAKEAGDTFATTIGAAGTGIYGAMFVNDGNGPVGTPNVDFVEPVEDGRNQGNDLIPGVAAEYADELTAIRIPIDEQTGQRYDIQSWRINEDGTIMGTDRNNRTIPVGQIALVSVENPNGLEKQDGYYYSVGPNCGDVEAIKPNGGPVGKLLGGTLEMANVDLANEFSNMITTQRGFQANSKIITVTDEMLQELVNMKR